MEQVREIFALANADQFVGQEIALSDWITIDQDQVDRFGAVTRWPTWMHVDPERCAKESPYGRARRAGNHNFGHLLNPSVVNVRASGWGLVVSIRRRLRCTATN